MIATVKERFFVQDGFKTPQEMQEAAEFDKILEAYTKGGVGRESVYGGTSTMRSGSMHYASVG